MCGPNYMHLPCQVRERVKSIDSTVYAALYAYHLHFLESSIDDIRKNFEVEGVVRVLPSEFQLGTVRITFFALYDVGFKCVCCDSY